MGMGNGEMHIEFWFETHRRRGLLADLSVDGK
jgi:hypothetical protein